MIGAVIAAYAYQAGHLDEYIENKQSTSVEYKLSDTDMQAVLDENKNQINNAKEQVIGDILERKDNYNSSMESIKITNAARSVAADMVNKYSGQEKKQHAAGIYAGYMARNAIGNHEYCQKLGVDITPFINALRTHNESLTQTAEQYYPSDNWENLVYKNIKPQIYPLIKQEFEDSSKAGNITPQDICRRLNADPAKVIPFIDFKTIMPEVHSALTKTE